MNIHIRSPKDFFAGLLFLIVGLLATWISQDYPMGTAVRMGPGYFPRALGVLTTLIGLIACVKGIAISGRNLEPIRVRPFLLVLAAVGSFAVSIESLGIVISTSLAVIISAAASPESRSREVAILLAFLLALAVGVFTYGLGLPFKLLPG